MKILKSIIASSIIATITIAASVQADELMDIIHPESADLFHFDDSIKSSENTGVFKLDQQSSLNENLVWSYEYEEYVSRADFTSENNIYNAQMVNRYMAENPTASGAMTEPVFKWDPVYDGYLLQ